jgi:hypothetical protein
VLDQVVRDLAGLTFRPGGAEDDSFVSHIESAVSVYFVVGKISISFANE